MWEAIASAPVAKLLILAGVVFLFVAAVGKIAGKVEPGKGGRVITGIIGAILMVAGISMLNRPQHSGTSGNGGYSGPEAHASGLSPDPFYLEAQRGFFLREFNIHGGLQWGRVYWQKNVWIGDKSYDHPLGMHAPDNGTGYADFKIPPGAKYFRTVFGLARDEKDPNPEKFGSAIGRIYLDGQAVWESGVSGPAAIHSPAIEIRVGAKELRLEVDSQGSNWGDQTTWGDPYFSAKKRTAGS